jgi:ornithine cyclodeaminase/alanine dehydrogenase-like protein (mu-crystallin family)
MPPIYISYLNRLDIQELKLTSNEIVEAVERGLLAQGRGDTVIEPRVFLEPNAGQVGHFNTLRGWIGPPIDLAGVKVVSDYVDNYKLGLPSELATLLLLDAHNGAPRAILDASEITDMRTGAMSALGAKHLASSQSKVLANIGARGTSYWNCRLIATLFELDEIRVHSRRNNSRDALVGKLRSEFGSEGRNIKIVACDDWESAISGADIVIEASRLVKPEPLFKTAWVKKGALIMPYGTMSAVELTLTDIMDKIFVDDWGQRGGAKGALRQHIDTGRLSEKNLSGELCDVVVGKTAGRTNDNETVLFWHRGLSLSDIALGHAMLEKASRFGIGQRLRFA